MNRGYLRAISHLAIKKQLALRIIHSNNVSELCVAADFFPDLWRDLVA